MEINEYRILFIDDDTYLLNLFKKWCDKSFKSHNFIFKNEFSYKDLIDNKYDILVCDYYLNGFTVENYIKKIREFDKDLLILVISGSLVIDCFKNSKCYNNPLLHNVIDNGANNVCQKDIKKILELLKLHLYVRINNY